MVDSLTRDIKLRYNNGALDLHRGLTGAHVWEYHEIGRGRGWGCDQVGVPLFYKYIFIS